MHDRAVLEVGSGPVDVTPWSGGHVNRAPFVCQVIGFHRLPGGIDSSAALALLGIRAGFVGAPAYI